MDATTPLLHNGDANKSAPPADVERNYEDGTGGYDDPSSSYGEVIRDMTIGFADGLTVPFALTAGLSSLGDTRLVVLGGLAELFSGAISMGLGAYLAAATERQQYETAAARTRTAVTRRPAQQREELLALLGSYGVDAVAAAPLADALAADPAQWTRFMLGVGARLDRPDEHRACISAATMGLSYFVGGLVPMLPYFFLAHARAALAVSVAVTALVLLLFGFVKNWVAIRTPTAGAWGALQTLVVGGLAAGTSYAIVRLLDAHGSSSSSTFTL